MTSSLEVENLTTQETQPAPLPMVRLTAVGDDVE
jgi:hypothetical protein